MTSPILVTGGTGTLGAHVVPLLRASGHEVRILTRHARSATDGIDHITGDLLKDEGVEAAVDGVETVLHLAGGPKGDDRATRALVRAATGAGVRHVVHISVIGADRVPLAWMRTKRESERAVADSGIDFPVSYGTTVLAATDGTVRTQWNSAYGNMMIVTAKDGTETWYCHLSTYRVASGTTVKAGDPIAYSGNSGNSTGPHLHFEVRPGGGSAIDPLSWLRSHGLDPS